MKSFVLRLKSIARRKLKFSIREGVCPETYRSNGIIPPRQNKSPARPGIKGEKCESKRAASNLLINSGLFSRARPRHWRAVASSKRALLSQIRRPPLGGTRRVRYMGDSRLQPEPFRGGFVVVIPPYPPQPWPKCCKEHGDIPRFGPGTAVNRVPGNLL